MALTLAVERHEGASLWLVLVDPKGPSRRLAKFVDAAAVGSWIAHHNDALMVAREVGRTGL